MVLQHFPLLQPRKSGLVAGGLRRCLGAGAGRQAPLHCAEAPASPTSPRPRAARLTRPTPRAAPTRSASVLVWLRRSVVHAVRTPGAARKPALAVPLWASAERQEGQVTSPCWLSPLRRGRGLSEAGAKVGRTQDASWLAREVLSHLARGGGRLCRRSRWAVTKSTCGTSSRPTPAPAGCAPARNCCPRRSRPSGSASSWNDRGSSTSWPAPWSAPPC